MIGLISSVLAFSCQSDEAVRDSELSALDNHEIEYLNLDLKPVPVEFVNPAARLQTNESSAMILYSAEYLTAGESNQMGKTIIFSDKGSKKLEFDFSPFASLDNTADISYYVDQVRPSSDLSLMQTDAAIERAFTTWDNTACSETGFFRVANFGVPIGYVAFIFGFPGVAAYVADVNHCGWMPASFFDMVQSGGSNFILGVTFTFLLVDGNGDYLDTNNDGKFDVALREIYYNDNFSWGDGSNIDVETVALHETGHGLSQAHFGKGFVKKTGEIQFAPRAVMNAAYSGIQTQLSGTDRAGHCSLWGNWPNK